MVSSGRRGAPQMTPAEINKTSAVANLRILVEQAIEQLKTFLLSHVNDILIVCSTLCYFKEP